MRLPPYKVFPLVESNNITLREIFPSDINDILEISFYNAMPAKNLNDAYEMLKKINDDYKNGTTVHWGIAEKSTNVITGTCGYYRGFKNETGELGCVLKPEFRGKGYITEAIKLAIDFGLNVIGLKKIIAITTEDNEKANNLMQRLGFSVKENNEPGKIIYELIKLPRF